MNGIRGTLDYPGISDGNLQKLYETLNQFFKDGYV